jgi:tetratricopeptide (TPR) repeat protein
MRLTREESMSRRAVLLGWIAAWTSVFAVPPGVGADSYFGLSPGVSTKQDADGILGNPVREVVRGTRYDYAAEEHEAKRLSVTFRDGVIQTISIYFMKPYAKRQLAEWFDLGKPTKTEINDEGNLVEFYIDKGISLHYEGPTDAAKAKLLSHFDRRVHERRPVPPPMEVVVRQLKEGEFPYLGIDIEGHDEEGIWVLGVHEGSPAEKGGLKKGDVILQLETKSFRRKEVNPREFGDFVKSMPVEEPLRFSVQRDQRQFEILIPLAVIREEQIASRIEKNRAKGEDSFRQGQQFLEQTNYARAVDCFKEATYYNPENPDGFTMLGLAQYKEQRLADAARSLQKAVYLKPAYRPYYLLGVVYKDSRQYDEAIRSLRRAREFLPKNSRNISAHELTGICYFKKGQIEDAVAVLLEANKIKKNSPITTYYLAACFDTLGEVRDAIYYYRKYLKLQKRSAKLEDHARMRLTELKKITAEHKKKELGHSLMKMYEVIKEEMDEYHSD